MACWISTTLHSESECNGVAAGKDHTRTAMSQYSISISFHSLSYGGGYESQRQLPYCDPIIFFFMKNCQNVSCFMKNDSNNKNNPPTYMHNNGKKIEKN